jgi:glycosyltransferase involved in cell wall biosynthesis
VPPSADPPAATPRAAGARAPLRVLQVTRGAIWGGGERHVASLLEAFRDRPAHLSLAVFAEGRLADEARRLGTPVHLVRKRFRGDPLPLWGLVRLIRRHRFDVVHTHMISGNVYGRLAARLARAPALVTTLHYIDRRALPFLPSALQRLFFDGDIRMSAMCDRVVTTSEHMRRTLIARGMDGGKLVTILNGINLDEASPDRAAVERARGDLGLPAGLPVVGIVGRLVPVKNHELFLRAARRVLDRGVAAHFVVVGDGPLRRELERRAAELGLAGRVTFAGFRSDVMTLLGLFDLCALTSHSETSAYAVSEPMAVGRPVVATAVGGVPELIDHGMDGWLCPPGDEAALADGLCALLGDRARASAMGERAARKVRERLSLRAMAERLETVYREALEAGR